jgi:hypothetical protein
LPSGTCTRSSRENAESNVPPDPLVKKMPFTTSETLLA